MPDLMSTLRPAKPPKSLDARLVEGRADGGTKGCTDRIRIELRSSALSLREMADRCGITGPRATHRIIPFVWQLERRREVVKIPGKPNRYMLAPETVE